MSDSNRKRFISMLIPVTLLVLAGCGVLGINPSHPAYEEMQIGISNYQSIEQHTESVPDLADNASLNEILAYGAAVNPGLKAMFHKWQATVENVTIAGALPDPKFSYTYFLQEIETKVGPQQHKLSFSQMIPSIGKLNLKEEVAIRAAVVKYREFETFKVNLFHKLRSAYFKYYYLSRATELVKENIDRLEILEPIIKQAYEAGKAPYNNLLRVQIAIEKEKERRATIDDSLVNLKYKLNSLLNRAPNSALPSPVIPQIDLKAFEKDDQLLQQLRKFNPSLAVLDGKIDQAEQALSLAQKQDAPDYMIGADWAITAKSGAPVEDDGKDPVMLMFGMNIPLYRAKYNAMESSAREMLRAARKMKHDKENILLAESRIVINDIVTADRRITLFKKNLIEKAKQSFEVSRTAFKGGLGDFLDMLDNIQLIIEMQLVVEKEISNKADKVSELTKLFGNNLHLFRED